MEVPEWVIPPFESFRYWPTPELIHQGKNEKSLRFIFYNTQFTEFEKRMIDNFTDKLRKAKIELPEYMKKEELIRMLHARRFDMKKAMQAVKDYIKWRTKTLPRGCVSLFETVEPFLNTGAVYVHGRDHRYRPLIVLNLERIMNFVPHAQDAINLTCFVLSYVVEYMMIPGQIENWIIICDLCKKDTSKLPISKLKKVMGVMQSAFRCRVIVNYVVNWPSGIAWIWGIVKGVLDDATKRKIKILKQSKPEELPSHFNLSQVEKKYGGTAPDAEEFWPPTMPEPPFNSANEPEGHFLSEVSSFPELDTTGMDTPQAQLAKQASGTLDHRDSLHALLRPMACYFNPNQLVLPVNKDTFSTHERSVSSFIDVQVDHEIVLTDVCSYKTACCSIFQQIIAKQNKMDISQELLDLIDKAQLPIPIELVEEIMQEVGCNTSDPRCAKFLAADCHKFLTDILNDIIDVSNIKPTPQLNPKHREQKMNLNVRDLQEALMEKGIDVNKPAFYLDRPSK